MIGPHDAVRLVAGPPAASIQIDYESELAVVIGTGGRDILAAHAMDHVFGYTVVNDVTARDVQMRHRPAGIRARASMFFWLHGPVDRDGR